MQQQASASVSIPTIPPEQIISSVAGQQINYTGQNLGALGLAQLGTGGMTTIPIRLPNNRHGSTDSNLLRASVSQPTPTSLSYIQVKLQSCTCSVHAEIVFKEFLRLVLYLWLYET